MRVSLGTIEVEDDVRKEIRKRVGGKGHATRAEIKDYLLELIEDHNKVLVAGEAEEAPETETETPVQSEWVHPEGGQTVDTLPEPTSAGDSTPSTAPPATTGV